MLTRLRILWRTHPALKLRRGRRSRSRRYPSRAGAFRRAIGYDVLIAAQARRRGSDTVDSYCRNRFQRHPDRHGGRLRQRRDQLHGNCSASPSPAPTASPNGTAPLYPAQGSCGAWGRAQSPSRPVLARRASRAYDATTSTTLTATDASGFHGSTGAFAVNGLTTASTLILTAATTTPTAGQTDALTITAADTWGNTVTSYTGQHNLTFSGASMAGTVNPTVTDRTGAAVNFGTAESITFTNGVSSAGGVMRLYRAETANIVVSDGTSKQRQRLTSHGWPCRYERPVACQTHDRRGDNQSRVCARPSAPQRVSIKKMSRAFRGLKV